MDAAVVDTGLARNVVIQWTRFVPGRPAKASYPARSSLCYMAFPDAAQAAVFAETFRAHKFVDAKSGMISRPAVEQAPNQYIPANSLKGKDADEENDPLRGTITEDPDYIRFMAVANDGEEADSDSDRDAVPPGVVIGTSSGARGDVFVTSLMEEVRRRKAAGETTHGRPGKQSNKSRASNFNRNGERPANGGSHTSQSGGRKSRANKNSDAGAIQALKPLAENATPTLMKRANPSPGHAPESDTTERQADVGTSRKGSNARRGRRQNARAEQGPKDSVKTDGVDSKLLSRGRGGSRSGRGPGRSSDRPKQRDRNPP